MVGWDPATGFSNEILAMSNMYETLTRYDSRTKKADPLLARSFRSSKGGTVWTFNLRRGVTFHSGRPMDAQAAKAAIMRTIKLKQGAAYVWDAVRRIDTPDRYTLVFRLKYAAPLDLNAAADYAAYIYDTRAAGGGDLAKWFAEGHDAGTGPYTVESWQRGQEVELRQRAYPDYWRGWSGAHYDRVEYWVVPTVTTQAQLIRAAMARQGVTVASFPQGTILTVSLHPLRDGRPFGAIGGQIINCGKSLPAAGCNEKTGKVSARPQTET